MELPLLTHLATLETRTSELARTAAALAAHAPAPLKPNSAGVAALFQQATGLSAAGARLAAAQGWSELNSDQQAAGRRIVATALHAARTATQILGTGPQFHAEATTSLTDPNSANSTRIWNSVRAGRDLPNVRIVGSLGRDAALGVANLFDQLPVRVIQQLDAQGCRSTLFSGKLTDVWGYRSLRGVQPRGWPAGKTWDVVPGVASGRRMAADPSRDQKGQGHGTESLALHELGHVVDRALAPPAFESATRDPAWLRGPQAEVRADRAATDYVRSYPEEWFAEALVSYTRSPQSNAALATKYPQTAAYLATTLGPPRFPTSKH